MTRTGDSTKDKLRRGIENDEIPAATEQKHHQITTVF